MKKRMISMLLLLAMLLSIVPAASAAEAASGTWGENLTWTLDDSGTLTISGTGSMLYTGDGYPWDGYANNIKHVVIEEGITNVGPCAFWRVNSEMIDPGLNYDNLISVSFPSTLESIGSQAFDGCGIVRLELPEGLKNIFAGAFENCPNLEYVKFPSSLEYLDYCAFSDCPKLSEIVMDNLSDEIGSFECFSNCDALTDLDFWTSTEIWESAFSYCDGFTVLNIPEGVVSIANLAFSECKNLSEITIPSTTEEIGPMAFYKCEKLKTIRFSGDAPTDGIEYFGGDYSPFPGVTATAYYPADNDTWTEEVMNAYSQGADITWIAYEPISFSDVPAGAWFVNEVKWAVDNGITNGTTATTFEPDSTCTRNQVVTFLWRAEGEPEPASTNNPFVDVKESDYFYKAVLWAVENGITNGMDATHFDPNGKCTRGQVVTFLHRAAGKPAPKSTDNPFTDVGQDYYTDAVLWAVGEGITDGMTPTTFEPNTTCTRAQIVTFLNRAYT